jgi:hypothetical protein
VRPYEDVDHVAVLIHGTPEILLLAVDSNEDFVQVPNIAKATLTPLQFSGIVRTELPTPDSNRFIRDDDSPFHEKILDISEAQAETMVNPDGIADDFWRKTMTVIARPVLLHGTSVSVRYPS